MNRSSAFVARGLLSLPRQAKRVIAIACDGALCTLGIWLALYLRVGEFQMLSGEPFIGVLVSWALALPIFYLFGLYNTVFRFSGWPVVVAIGQAILVYGLLFATIVTFIRLEGVPRTVGLIQPVLLFLLMSASRILIRIAANGLEKFETQSVTSRALVYGAGAAGRLLVQALRHSHDTRCVGFVDDDVRLHGHNINGLTVYGIESIEHVIEKKQISEVLMAIPNASQKRRNEILSELRRLPVAVKSLPPIDKITNGEVRERDLNELDVDDLLGREPVPPNAALLARNIAGRTVAVTGAGGSIGSELCRQVCRQNPKRIVLVDHNEFALYTMDREIARVYPEIERVALLLSVLDQEKLTIQFKAWQVETVYHAAAYKHVPLVEQNPAVGISNNVFGTWRTALAAIDADVEQFVLISTDKAVRPTNIMGASKRVAEMGLQALATSSDKTCFSMVRFGNVLGSSGSVVPLFREQIRRGGPVTVTDPKITRFFMTIPEAAQLVIQAGAMARGGEVFVLDMGEPVRIIDLARRMIELSGLTVAEGGEGDIAIETVGLRSGEKLFEELLIGDDPQDTDHPRIMMARDQGVSLSQYGDMVAAFTEKTQGLSVAEMKALLAKCVAGYSPEAKHVDWLEVAPGGVKLTQPKEIKRDWGRDTGC